MRIRGSIIALSFLVNLIGSYSALGQQQGVQPPTNRSWDWRNGTTNGKSSEDIPKPGPETSPDGTIGLKTSQSAAQLFEVANDKPVGPPLQHDKKTMITAWAFSPDGKLVATGTYETGRPDVDTAGDVRVWEVSTGKLLAKYGRKSGVGAEYIGGIDGLSFSRDGKIVWMKCQPLSGK